MSFEDLLKKKLPSQANTEDVVTEGFEEEGCGIEGCVPETAPAAPIDSYDDDIESDLASIDLDGVSDDEVEDISEDDLAAVDGEPEADLTADEEIEADQAMALVATPIMLDKELSESVIFEEFVNELPMAISEGFLLESDIDDYVAVNTGDIFTEKRVFAAKTRVMLDENDRRKQLFEVGVQASARAHNDPLYWKLQKVYKLERVYKAKLRQKYRGEALKRVKAYVKKLKSSTSKVLSSLGNKITGK